MFRVITGATGLVGKRLVERWLDAGHHIKVIGRSDVNIQTVFGERVQAITWDRLQVSDLEDAEVVVNLAGANIAAKRWTAAYKQEIISSRVNATQRLAEMLATLGAAAPPLFNASAIGIYGLQETTPTTLPPRYEEISAIDCEIPADFLSLVGCRWEGAADAAIKAGVRVIFLRFGVVLAREGGALPGLARPFKLFVGGVIGSGNQAFSWVAIDDLLRAIDFILMQKTAAGPFNIVAPGCVQEKELAKTLGRILHRPALLPMPSFVLKILCGREMAEDLLLKGQHVYPARLLEAGFEFKYPTIDAALNTIFVGEQNA